MLTKSNRSRAPMAAKGSHARRTPSSSEGDGSASPRRQREQGSPTGAHSKNEIAAPADLAWQNSIGGSDEARDIFRQRARVDLTRACRTARSALHASRLCDPRAERFLLVMGTKTR